MCKIKFDWLIFKYCIFTLIELILSISGLISVLSVYALYNSTLIFYFMLYNIIISIFSIFHFIKVFRDMINEQLNDITYVKIKILMMVASFIWGIVILQHREIILFFQNNYPRVYVSFINYFIMSSLSILDIIYKIFSFINKKKAIHLINKDYEFLVKIDQDFAEEKPQPKHLHINHKPTDYNKYDDNIFYL
jgi:hypothetical protein